MEITTQHQRASWRGVHEQAQSMGQRFGVRLKG